MNLENFTQQYEYLFGDLYFGGMDERDHSVSEALSPYVFDPKHAQLFRQCRIWREQDAPFLIKELVDNVITEGERSGIYRRKDAIAGYRLAKTRLGGLVVPFSMNNIYINSQEDGEVKCRLLADAVVMNKVKYMDLRDNIRSLASAGQLEGIKTLIRKLFAIDDEVMRRGCFLPDINFDNFGHIENDDNIFLHDVGFLVSDSAKNKVKAADIYLRGRIHHFNNDFLLSLKECGLSDEQIKELQDYYGECSGVWPSQFNDQYFAKFANDIKEDRYWDIGMEEYEQKYNKEATPQDFIRVPSATGEDHF